MTKVKINVPNFDFTPIDNVFIDNYMTDTRGDFIKVYLFILRLGYSNISMGIEEISNSLNLLQTDVQRALEFWESKGLMKITPTGVIEMVSPRIKEELKNEVFFDNPVKEMFNGIEKLVGRPLSSKELSVYMSFIEDFNFSPELINILIEYCSSKKKTDIRYIEKVAMTWNDAGIKTLNDAQNHITKFEDKWTKYRAIINYMGFKDNEISKPQEDMLEKWLFKFNMTSEVIQEACKISVMRINECNFKYIDTILCDWQDKGIRVLEDVKKSERKAKPFKKNQANNHSGLTQTSSKRQYDVDALEKQLLGRGEKNEK